MQDNSFFCYLLKNDTCVMTFLSSVSLSKLSLSYRRALRSSVLTILNSLMYKHVGEGNTTSATHTLIVKRAATMLRGSKTANSYRHFCF